MLTTVEDRIMLKQILRNYFDTYNDEKTFPKEEYPDLWKELDWIREFLGEGI